MHLWNTLNDTSALLKRSELMELKYKKHISRVLKKHVSLSSYVQCMLQKKKHSCKNGMYFTVNKFPYDLEDDVTHFILWNTKQRSKVDCLNYLKRYIDNNFWEICLRENKKEHRSVPDIMHYHVFVR